MSSRRAHAISLAGAIACLAGALATGAPAVACEQKFAIACGPDAQRPDKLIVIEGGSYYFLKPHGGKGRVQHCSAAEIRLADDTGHMQVDRRSGRYVARWREWTGRDREESGVCAEHALPPG